MEFLIIQAEQKIYLELCYMQDMINRLEEANEKIQHLLVRL
jgi:hypothetical protein